VRLSQTGAMNDTPPSPEGRRPHYALPAIIDVPLSII
jgi:hypothetical protein